MTTDSAAPIGPKRPTHHPRRISHILTPWWRPRNWLLVLWLGLGLWFTWTVIAAAQLQPSPNTAASLAKMRALQAKHQPPGQDGWPIVEQLMLDYETLRENTKAWYEAEVAQGPLVIHPTHGVIGVDFLWDSSALLADPQAQAKDKQIALGLIPSERYEAIEPTQRYATCLIMQEMLRLETELGIRTRIAELARRPRIIQPFVLEDEEDSLVGVILPELGVMRQLAQLECCHVRQAIAAGDDQAAVQALRNALALARASGAGGVLISRLVEVGIRWRIINAISPAEDGLDEKAMLAMLRMLEEQPPPPSLIIEMERIYIHDFIARMYSNDNHGDGILLQSVAVDYINEDPTAKWLNAAGHLMPRRRDTTKILDDYYDDVQQWAELSGLQRSLSSFSATNYINQLPPKYFLPRVLLPALQRAFAKILDAEHETRQLRLRLALEIHHRRHGRYPSTLSQLVPGILQELPTNTWSKTGDFFYTPPATPGGPYTLSHLLTTPQPRSAPSQ